MRIDCHLHGRMLSMSHSNRVRIQIDRHLCKFSLGNDACSAPNGGAQRVLVVNWLFRLFILGTGGEAHFSRFLDVESRVKSRVHCLKLMYCCGA